MIGALVAELRKTLRRPAVWVCLGILLVLLIGLGYAIVWVVYSHPPKNFEQSLPRGLTVRDLKATLYPVRFERQVVGISASIGSALALVLGVLAVGSEYGWNTLKTLFTQRPGRLVILAAKLLSQALLMLVFAIAMMAAGAAASLVIGALDGVDLTLPSAETMLRALLATWLLYIVWNYAGALLAFAFRQSALAIGLGLVYVLIVENLLFQLLGLTGSDWFRQVEQWFPAANSTGLAQSFGRGVQAGTQAVAPVVTGGHAVAVLLVYAAVFAAGSAAFLRYRDVD